MTTWLLDTNVLVQAHRRDYGMDFCPAFWDWLVRANRQNKVFTLDRKPPRAVPSVPGRRRRVSPFAAGLVTAWLGLGAAMQAAPAHGGIASGTTMPMRKIFGMSDLVVEVVIGRSRPRAVEERGVEMETELLVGRVVKGEAPSLIQVRHLQWKGDPDLVAGARGIAFLDHGAEDASPSRAATEPFFRMAYGSNSIRELEPRDLEVWIERFEALVELERRDHLRGGADPVAMVEWLVDGVDHPVTRADASLELAGALTDLGHLAIDPHRRRLEANLQSCEKLGPAERALFELVQKWNPRVATAWLKERLRIVELEPDDAEDAIRWLIDYAAGLELEKTKAFADEAEEHRKAIFTRASEDGKPDAWERGSRQMPSFGRELMRELAELLPNP